MHSGRLAGLGAASVFKFPARDRTSSISDSPLSPVPCNRAEAGFDDRECSFAAFKLGK